MSPGAAGQGRKTKVKKCAIKHIKNPKNNKKKLTLEG